MNNNLRWTPEQLRQNGLVQNEKGDYVKVSSLVNKGKVEKLPNLIDRAIGGIPNVTPEQAEIIAKQLKESQERIAKTYNLVQASNQKVKNATKIEVDGVKFDSKLEKYMYDLLKGAQIDFEFQKVFVLQPKFKYRTENVRAIFKVVDFYLESRSIIIDTKGFSNDVSPMKHKMLKFALMNDYVIQPDIIMPKDKQECNLLLNRLLYDKP